MNPRRGSAPVDGSLSRSGPPKGARSRACSAIGSWTSRSCPISRGATVWFGGGSVADVLEADGPASIAAAARALDRGDLVVLPTDTVYGLAARPDLPGATTRVFEAK